MCARACACMSVGNLIAREDGPRWVTTGNSSEETVTRKSNFFIKLFREWAVLWMDQRPSKLVCYSVMLVIGIQGNLLFRTLKKLKHLHVWTLPKYACELTWTLIFNVQFLQCVQDKMFVLLEYWRISKDPYIGEHEGGAGAIIYSLFATTQVGPSLIGLLHCLFKDLIIFSCE